MRRFTSASAIERALPASWALRASFRYERTSPVGAIHTGDFKLMEFFETGAVELYNIREDSGEMHNLAAQSPAKVKELQAKLAAWRTQVGAAMPTMKTGKEIADAGSERRGDAATKKKNKQKQTQ